MTDPDHILNWRRLSPLLTTSGQPSEIEFQDIAKSGITHVINLGPHSNKGALDDEPATLRALGLGYTYIPVDFDAPSENDFAQFCAALTAQSGHKTHIHCIYNARVSAFFTRWQNEERGALDVDMTQLIETIWRPGGVWAAFLGDQENIDQPNRYKGYEYE